MKRWDFNTQQKRTTASRIRQCKSWQCFLLVFFCLITLAGNTLTAQTSPFEFQRKTGSKTRVQQKDCWFGKDKFDHFVASAFLTSFTYYAAREHFTQTHTAAFNFAGGITLALGAGKEIRDKNSRSGVASFRDFIADFLGVGVGLLIGRVSS